MRTKTDVVVVGGGPAGLAAAIALRLRGLAVVVLDPRRPPIDKACGEGLMPAGVAALAALGVAPPGRPFRGIAFRDAATVAVADFPSGSGVASRRTALHATLVERAATLGAELRWGEAARSLLADGVATGRGAVAARFVVGADGLHSRVRAWSGLAAGPAARRRFGQRAHFAIAPWSDRVEVHWGERAEAYVSPVGEAEVGVAFLWSASAGMPRPSLDDLLSRFGELRARLGAAPRVSAVRGAGPLEQRVRGVVAGNLALLGDAGGYVDAITGEGLALAFREAQALAAALAAGTLAGYSRAARRIRRLPEALTRLLLVAERRPAARRRLLRTLAGDPALFARLLGVQQGTLAAPRVGLLGALRLATCALGSNGEPWR
ncbi:MAG: NAD(P)/FAD-dependent oxidoreductase [Acidobacteriota bacterium]